MLGARDLTTQVADESHAQREELTGLIGQGKREAGLGHLADELTLAVVGQWEKGPDIREGLQPRVLIGSQDGYHRMSCLSQISQERCGHAFSVDDDACVCRFPACLFIASQHVGQSRCQMLIPTRRCDQARMPLLVMQKHEGTTAQNLAGTTDESTRKQAIGIDSLAVAINVETRR